MLAGGVQNFVGFGKDFSTVTTMRRWYLPLTVVGLGGLGYLFLTGRGRQALRWATEHFQDAPERFLEWNEAAQRELDRIQGALNRVADSLEGAR